MKLHACSSDWRRQAISAALLCLASLFSVRAQPASPPAISIIPAQGGFPNATSRPVAFVVGDAETSANLLSLSGISANQTLVPDGGIVFGGAGSNRTATITPSLNQTGATTITITVTDANGGVASNSFAFDVAYFTPVASGLPYLAEARFAWGDYDNDGLPDLLANGYDGAAGNYVTRIYRNLGGNFFADVNADLSNAYRAGLSWVDYNRDGYLDVSVADGSTQLYRNVGGSSFAPVASGLPNLNLPASAWGDFDNDGDPDLALLGTSGDGFFPLLYRNNSDDTFTGLTNALPLLYLQYGSADWGDFDNDGDVDLVLSGREVSLLTKVYRNDGKAGFIEIAALLGVYNSCVRWGDYDNDGDLDILLTGGVGDVQPSARIYRNNGDQTFTDIGAGLTGATLSSSDWGDFDNDGDLDAVISGYPTNSVGFARIYVNNSNQTFAPLPVTFSANRFGGVAWADTDRDGDLDLLVYGESAIQLYRNNAPSNAPPLAPTGLSINTSTNGDVIFKWNAATDSRTASAGLGYNLRVGTNSGGLSIVTPQADPATGRRRVVLQGLTHTNRWKISDLPKGTYFWSVQAVDSALAGSPFAPEQSFTLTNAPPQITVAPEVHTGPSALVSLPFTVTDAESPAPQIVVAAQSANDAFILPASISVSGTGTARTVTFRIGSGQLGTNELILQARDPLGFFREERVRVVSEFFTATPLFETTNFYSLTPLHIGWGYPYGDPVVDVDLDGDLDVLFSATVWSNNYIVPRFVIASNDGSGQFSFNIVTNSPLPFGTESYWFDDFNRDGIGDLLAAFNSQGVQLLAGDGVGGFGPPQKVGASALTHLADMDNDGDVDGLAWIINPLAGNPTGVRFFRNVGGQFQANPGPPLMNFTTYQESWSARVTDFDQDGDPDFFISGEGTNLTQRLVQRTLRNNGSGGFTQEEYLILPGPASVYGPYIYDADDDRDLDVTFQYETNYSGPILRGMGANNGSGAFYFTTNITVPGAFGGDFDNDGDLDRWISEVVSVDPYRSIKRLSFKIGTGQYVPQGSGMSDSGMAADFDGDGDLDYLVTTPDYSPSGMVVSPERWKYFRNNTDHTNAPPAVPAGLTATQRTDDRITFAWNAAADDHTPTNWTSYNLRVGTTPGGLQIVSPCANLATGRRYLSGEGNVGALTFRDVRGLPSGSYYWSVQAVDGVFAASAWSPEQSITIVRPSISPLDDVVTPPGIASKPMSFSVTGGSSPVNSLTITVVADDPTLIPNPGLVVTGTGTNRTLTITPANRSGDTDLTLTATDLAGFSAIVRCHVRVAWWDAVPLEQIGIQRFEQWRWVDADLDGGLDFFGYTPVGNATPQLFSFHNLGGAQFESVSNNLPGWSSYPVEVAGFGGDNVADVLTLQRPDANTSLFQVWQGTGGGFAFLPLTEVSNRSAVVQHLWLDVDNDGWKDVVHTGSVTPAPANAPAWALLVARGKPDGTFEYLPQRIGMYSGGVIAAADFDGDGDFDLVVTGTDYAANGQDAGTNFLRVYVNEGGGRFTPNPAGLPQAPSFYKASVADFDSNGWPDLLLTPYVTGAALPRLMRNVGGTFVEAPSALPTALDVTTWADFDNDGDSDLLGVCSVDLSYIDFGPSSAAIFRNDGGVLTRADAGLPAIAAHHASFADVDTDGDLDLLISGETGWNVTGRFLCLNSATHSNTPPPAPTALSLAYGSNGALLQWTAAADAESGTALSYNLRVGTTPGGSEIMSAVADPVTGQRRLTGMGNIGHAPRWRLSPADGTYYWTVQAIDAGFAASSFAPEISFTYYHPTLSTFTNELLFPGAGPAVQSFTVGDPDSAAASLMISAFSSNPDLLPLTNITFSGTGSNRVVSLSPANGMGGTSLVSVVVTDVTGLTATNSLTLTVEYFSERASGLPGGGNGTPSLADYDGDSDLDVYLAGKIFRNDGGTNFALVATVLAGQRNGVVWADYDRDGDLDLAVAGGGPTKIYRNDGAGVFTDSGAVIPDAGNAAVAWGDYDNDGDLDLLSLGNGLIYRNGGTNGFMGVAVGLPVVGYSGVAWGDYDGDGYQDVLLSGYQGGTVAGIYRNTGNNTFTNLGIGLPGFYGASVDWGDYDSDGDLDVLVAGAWSTFNAHIFQNLGGGTFVLTNDLPGVAYGSAQWVDFDNDGRLDIFLCGNVSNYPNLDYAAYLYRNNGDGTFSDTHSGLPKGSTAAWGDLDGDADLDLIVSGSGIDFYRLLQNQCPTPNSPPAAPSGLLATLLPDNNVLLSWLPASDLENTNPAALNYALQAGLAPGGAGLVSPHAAHPGGYRRLPERGPLNACARFLPDVPRGTYYWSVQAIDAGFSGSPFSAEGSFTITNARPLISAISNQVTVPGRPTPPLNFTVSDFETEATNLVVHGYSTNPAIVPNGNIVFGGAGSNRTVTLTTVPGVSGTATIIIGVTDGGGLVATSRFDVVVQTFTEMSVGLPVSTTVATAWGDYDNDGDLDMATAGPQYGNTAVYRNTNGSFTNQNFTLPATGYYLTPTDLAWLDFDNDGDLDLAESGWLSYSSGYTPATLRLRNNYPANSFTSISTNLPGTGVTNIADGAMAWGDYDNDGDLDVVLSGDPNTYHSPDAFTALYRNDRGVFTNSRVVLPALVRGAAVWGDYDHDGDLDLLLAGQTGSVATNSVTKLFRNDGAGGFTEIATPFPGVTDCALAFGDMDNDGDLDLALAGTGMNAAPLTRIYRNTGNGGFTNLTADLKNVTYASVSWGDFDNDGFADLVVSGATNPVPYYNAATVTTTVYRNYGGVGFTNIGGALPGVMMQNTSWGDADNDGDLDLLVGTRVVRNNWNLPNTPPSAPTNLSVVLLANNDVRLAWTPATDVETTNSRGLSYNLRLGTNSGGGQIMAPLANGTNGYHRVPNFGNAGPTNFWRIANLTNGTYHWSVQAIDSGLAGSGFAAEQTFTLSRPVFSVITNRSVFPNAFIAPINFTVSDNETAASNLVVTASSSDSNLVANANLVVNGTGQNRSLLITPATNRSGRVTITLTAMDESGQMGGTSFVLVVERFADIAAGFSPVVGAVAWGDYDNDGNLDLARGSTIYRNTGLGTFVNLPLPNFPTPFYQNVAWGDYDNDTDLDLMFGNYIYRNEGAGNFVNLPSNLNALALGLPAWGDSDNDGDLDLIYPYGNGTYLYRNNGNNTFSNLNSGLPYLSQGSVAWGDFDKDGDLDVLAAGNNTLRVYRNNGNNGFTEVTPALPGLYTPSVAWGDFDNDGDLDFAAIGSTNNSFSGVVTRIYRNTTNSNPNLPVFSNLYPVAAQGPVGVWKGAVAWGDYDNDGDLDLLTTGETTNILARTRIYRNDSGNFVDSGDALPALKNSFAAWGDFDNDGSLDLALSGNENGGPAVARIYRNYANGVTNVPPNSPGSLTNIAFGKSIRLSWAAATDANQSAGLSYNLRLGTTPGGGEVVGPMAGAAGLRQVAALGNANERLTWTITNLTGGTFYWSVQAVDHSFAGSAFASEGSFVISNRLPLAVAQNLTTSEDTSKALTLTGSDPDADPLTFNIATPPLFGQLTGTPPNVTYRPATNYAGFDQFTFRAHDRTTNSGPASVFITVTPVADVAASSLSLAPLGGGQFQLSLLAEPWRSYRLEASEDLIHWQPLTNLLATNLLTLLVDADAPNFPQRFYRAAQFSFAPELGGAQLGSNNQFQFTLTGEPGRNYQVQVSPNLVTWTPLTNVFMTNAVRPFVDGDAVKFPSRFYRLVAP